MDTFTTELHLAPVLKKLYFTVYKLLSFVFNVHYANIANVLLRLLLFYNSKTQGIYLATQSSTTNGTTMIEVCKTSVTQWLDVSNFQMIIYNFTVKYETFVKPYCCSSCRRPKKRHLAAL